MSRPAAIAVLNPDQLRKIGHALYGEQWQSALARDLQISDRSMRYLADGTRPVHEGITQDLQGLVNSRRADLAEIFEEIGRALVAADIRSKPG